MVTIVIATVLLLTGNVTQTTEPPITQTSLPTTVTEHKIPTYHPHSHPHPPPTTTEQHRITPPSTEKPRVSYETTTQLPSNEHITNVTNADSSLGGQHGPGVAVIAGVTVSVSVVVLMILAAVVVMAVVVPGIRGVDKGSATK